MTHLTLTAEQFRAHQAKVQGKPSKSPQERTPAAEAATAKPDRWPLVLRDQIVAAGLPEPLREPCFHPTRGWRSDLAWPDQRIAVEIEGGAHGARKQRERDCEKHNAYMLLDWRYLRVLPRWVETGQALHLVREMLVCKSKDVDVDVDALLSLRPGMP